jgi:hypothetical protein
VDDRLTNGAIMTVDGSNDIKLKVTMRVALRAIALLAVVMVAAAGTVRLAAPPLARLADAWAGPGPVLFETALEGGCAVLLAACTCWVLFATGAAVAAVVLRSRGRGRLAARLDGICPALLRGLVVAVVGATVTAGMASGASADDSAPPATTPLLLDGLPLPDRALGSGPPPAHARPRAAALRVVVRPGDSLWVIASRALPSSASSAATASAVRRLYATNAGRIGPDPDLVQPGTPLVLPDLSPPRKDHS